MAIRVFFFLNMRSALPLLQSVATKRIIVNNPRIIINNIFVYSCLFMYIRVQKK